MTFLAVAGGIAVVAGGVKAGTGIAQARRGSRLQEEADAARVDYTIPEGIEQNVALAEQRGLQGLPEEQKAQYIQNLQQQQLAGLQQAGSRRAGLTGIAAQGQQQILGYQNLLAQDSAARMQNQKEIYAQRTNLAQYQDRAYEANTLVPFYEKTAQAQALQGAGRQNISGGLDQIGTGALGVAKGLGGAGGDPFIDNTLNDMQIVR